MSTQATSRAPKSARATEGPGFNSWKLWLFFPFPEGSERHFKAFGQRQGGSLAVTAVCAGLAVAPSLSPPQGAGSSPRIAPSPPQRPEPTYLGPLIRLANPQPKLLSQLLTKLSYTFVLGRQDPGWAGESAGSQSCAADTLCSPEGGPPSPCVTDKEAGPRQGALAIPEHGGAGIGNPGLWFSFYCGEGKIISFV